MPAWKKVITSGSDASLNSLTVTNGVTGSLQGTSSWATNVVNTASNATAAATINVTLDNATNASYYPVFTSGISGNQVARVDNATLTYNPGTNTLTTTTFAGTATNATNVAVTNTTTGTGPYYVMFADATTGNVAARVDSAALTFNATTNVLTATASYATQALSASYAPSAGGVTSVATSGTVNGITLTGGTITSTGTITLGGTLSGIGNSQLTNSSVTVGSTAISLGSSATTIAGLSSVTSTTFVGALTGNASTATSASISTNLAGGYVLATSIYGTSVNIAGNGASADPYGTIAITQPANSSNYSYYGLTRAGNIGAGFGITGTTGALGLGANAYWFGTATAGLAGTMAGAWLAFNGSSLVAVGTISGSSFSGAGTGLTGITNSNLSGTAGITNANLANSAITIAGTSTSLGGSISQATILAGSGVFSGSAQISGLTNSNLSGTAGITNANLANSSVTVGSTAISLGSSATTIAGLSSVTSTTFVGALTGNASTATSATSATTATTATNATNIAITDTTTTAGTYYPVFVSATTGNVPARTDSSTFTYNPNTNTLTVGTVSGNLSGTASTATVAGKTVQENTGGTGTFYMMMTPTAVGGDGRTYNTSNQTDPISYNAATATLTSKYFVGALTGNASTATSAATLTTARTLTIGSTGKSFNGSANVAWSLAEIGAQAALTNPVTGTGTTNYLSKFTGTSTIGNSQIFDNGTNVGINTATPETELHIEDVTKVLTGNVAGVAQGTLSLAVTDAQAANIGPSLVFGGRYVDGSQTRIAYAGIAGRKDNSSSVNADGYLSFLTWRSTGLTEAMRITPAGRLGINTTSPGHVLDVNGSGNATYDFRAPIFYDTDNTAYYVNPHSVSKLYQVDASSTINASVNVTAGANITATGYMYATSYIQSAASMYSPIYYEGSNSAYYFDGGNTGDSIRTAGNIVAYYSDERLKDNKGNIENALEKLLTLNGFYYEPNERAQELGYKKKMEIGVSAQEVEAILPEIVNDAPIGYGYKTLDYSKLVPLLIEAIKEQQKQIDELKSIK